MKKNRQSTATISSNVAPRRSLRAVRGGKSSSIRSLLHSSDDSSNESCNEMGHHDEPFVPSSATLRSARRARRAGDSTSTRARSAALAAAAHRSSRGRRALPPDPYVSTAAASSSTTLPERPPVSRRRLILSHLPSPTSNKSQSRAARIRATSAQAQVQLTDSTADTTTTPSTPVTSSIPVTTFTLSSTPASPSLSQTIPCYPGYKHRDITGSFAKLPESVSYSAGEADQSDLSSQISPSPATSASASSTSSSFTPAPHHHHHNSIATQAQTTGSESLQQSETDHDTVTDVVQLPHDGTTTEADTEMNDEKDNDAETTEMLPVEEYPDVSIPIFEHPLVAILPQSSPLVQKRSTAVKKVEANTASSPTSIHVSFKFPPESSTTPLFQDSHGTYLYDPFTFDLASFETSDDESDGDISRSEFDYHSDEDGSLVDINNAWVQSVQKAFSFKFPAVPHDATIHKGHIPATFLHQIFTESLYIYGYRGLSIEIDINPTTCHTYIKVGYRSSVFDQNRLYRGRRPRVVIDKLSPEAWEREKKRHVLCDFTYTTDAMIEVLNDTIREKTEEIARAESELQQQQQEKIRNKKNIDPQDRKSAMDTLRNCSNQRAMRRHAQQRQQQSDIEELHRRRNGSTVSSTTVAPTPSNDTNNSNNLPTKCSASFIQHLQQVYQDQNASNSTSNPNGTVLNTVRSQDQQYDEETNSLSSLFTFPAMSHTAQQAMLERELESECTNGFVATPSPSTTAIGPNESSKSHTKSLVAASNSNNNNNLPPSTPQPKRLKMHGNDVDDVDVEDAARVRFFSVRDMPSLEAIYFAVARHWPQNVLCQSQEEFAASYDQIADFEPPGRLLESYNAVHYSSVSGRQALSYHIYIGSLNDPIVREYHQRIQPLLLHYIDNASFIDSNDGNWEILFLFEKTSTLGKGNRILNFTWKICGFTTLYTFYRPQGGNRLRLSQILVFPCSQHCGHGAHMLNAVYALAKERNSYEVNIEDPSIGMQRLRDNCDVERATKLGFFLHPSQYFTSSRHPVLGQAGPGGCCCYSAEQLETIRQELCITRLQCQRIMECICLSQLDINNEDDMRVFRLRVKRRFLQSHKDELSGLNSEERKEQLQQLFQKEWDTYLAIHKKLRIKC